MTSAAAAQCRLTVHWHLVNLRRVELLNVTQNSDVVILHEVNSHTLATEPTGATNSGNQA